MKVGVVMDEEHSLFEWTSTMFDEGRFEQIIERLGPSASLLR